MRYEDLTGKTLTEDLNSLNTSAFKSNDFGKDTVTIKQNMLVRFLKKLTAVNVFGSLGMVAGGGIGAALGVGFGMWWAGKKTITKQQERTSSQFLSNKGMDKPLNDYYEKYFSDSALSSFINDGEDIANAFYIEKQNDVDKSGVFSKDPKRREELLKDTRDYVLRPVTSHLNDAGAALLEMAKTYDVTPHQAATLFALEYGDGHSPINYFMNKVIGDLGIF